MKLTKKYPTGMVVLEEVKNNRSSFRINAFKFNPGKVKNPSKLHRVSQKYYKTEEEAIKHFKKYEGVAENE